MDIRLLHTEEDYRAALAEASTLVDIDPEPNTLEGDRLELLGVLIGRYEDEHFPLERPDPIEAIKFRMEQEQLSIADMQEYIGGANRVYEVLAGKRALTLAMIRRLHEGLHIPAEVLIREPIRAGK
ncbi:transcriptional regulator [Caballeronia sp. dw_276]|jgi:HTH-type transcriptional regulator / antitoxin HigA|uniref:helix-turn-helix domain-containing protein n=1 Tax=Caballeronia sp. dw_276 TaxID=2719795 RepID=UPI001BD1DE9E|nr:transcriptional regulator [Caballeronia sp. dw_276]